MTPTLEVDGITKRFPGVLANNKISFQLEKGEIHALLGENGAGKTTLMDILYGLLQPDEGSIYVRGQRVQFHSPLDALAHGIGMVHQHFLLVPTLTVGENIMLGQELTRGPFLLPREATQRIRAVAAEFGIDVDPERRVSQLSVGEQQRVEILKALFRGAVILILDEPTAAITPPEADALFCTLKSMRQRGKSVIFISHKLQEVMAISDRVTVLRRGKVIGTVQTAATTERELAQMMVGRDVVLGATRPAHAPFSANVVCALRGLQARSDRGDLAVKGVNLELREGEIVGVAGVDGNGQSELAETLAGLRRLAGGELLIDGQEASAGKARRQTERGVNYVPADRNVRGAVGSLSVAANAVLKSHRNYPYSRLGILNHRAIADFARGLVRDYDVRCASLQVNAGTLSGGNLQKLILGRETAPRARMLIVEHPTRGLDISATEYVRHLLVRQAEEGTAVLLFSADLDELLALSDRIVVMCGGALVYEAERDAVDMERLGLAMAGLEQSGGMDCTEQ